MAISDTQKVDYLFKKVGYTLSKTDTATAKSPANESIPSPLITRGDYIWQQSNSIPTVIPNANSSVITVYSDALNDTVKATVDGTSTANRTWLTGLTNWIDPSFGSTYQAKVYVVESGTTNPQTVGYQLFADGSGNNDSWYFDYSSGVLNFPDTNLPYYANGLAVSFTGKSIFVSGARYTGQTGLTTFVANTGVANNLTVSGNLTVIGNVNNIIANVYSQGGIFYGAAGTGMNALYAGVTGFTPLANTVVQISGNINNFAQVNAQNSNSGAQASTDYVATANNGNQNDTYIDMGINSSGYNQPAFSLTMPNDGYLYVAGNTVTGGGNLILSTTTLNDIVFSLAGTTTVNEFARMRANTNSFVISSTTAANSITSGALQVLGGASVGGNLYANSFYGDGSHLTGVTSYSNANVASYLPVYGGNINANIFTNNITALGANGNININPTGSGIVAINSNSALLLPVGSSSNYPANPSNGMVRWNTSYGYMEVYTGVKWEAVGIEGGTTAVVSDVFSNADGNTYNFTLSQNNTTTGTLVSINGVIQLPTTSYTVSGNVITFSEAPLSTDVIEVRQYVPTTTISSIVNANAIIQTVYINGLSTSQFINDGLTTLTVDSLKIQTSVPLVANVANTAVNSTTALINSFSPTQYRTAKYIVSCENYNSSSFQTAEALVIHNGTIANIFVGANANIGSALFTLSANIYSSNVSLWATTTSSGNNIKVSASYIPV